MFRITTNIPKVTTANIKAIQAIVPGIETITSIPLVETPAQAVEVAKTMNLKYLTGYEYFANQGTIQTVKSVEEMTDFGLGGNHLVLESEDKFTVSLLTFGD